LAGLKMFVMIAYDVPAERTEIYKKLLKEYLIHEQASVFMGDLPESETIKLVARIAEKIRPEDKVLKLVCRNRHNVEVHRLGKDALGGAMHHEEDGWYGKNWSVL